MSDEFDESPLAGRRSYESAYYQEGTSDEPAADKNNSAAPMDDEDGEDVPNWIAFADFAKCVGLASCTCNRHLMTEIAFALSPFKISFQGQVKLERTYHS
jgi:hypothetical protein